MTAATLGYGTKLKMGDGASPEVFTEIGEVGDFEDSDSVELVKVTNHQSPNNRHEYISGLIDGDEIQFPVNYIPTNATHNRTTGLQAKLRSTVNFRIEEPGNSTGIQFAAVVIGVTKAYPVEDKMTMTVTLKKTGAITTYAVS